MRAPLQPAPHWFLLLPLTAGLVAASACSGRPASVAQTWTSSRQVRSLCAWRGRIWAATGGGLLRADPGAGKVAKLVGADGLPESDVLEVLPWGDRLVSGARHGAAVFDGRRWQTLPPVPSLDPAHPPALQVFGRRLLAVSRGALYALDEGSPAAPRWASIPVPEPVRLAGSAGGRAWLVGERTVWSSRDTQEWTRRFDAPSEIPVALVECGDCVALATRQAVYLFDGRGCRRVAATGLPGATHLSGCVIQGNRLLLAAHGSGMWDLDPRRAESSHTSPWKRHPSGAMRALRCALPAGADLWMGTTEGLRCWSAGEWRTLALPDEPPGNVVVALARHAGDLWIATQDAGMACLAGGRWETRAGPDRAQVVQLAAAGGRLWARHPDGSLSYREGNAWHAFQSGSSGRLKWVSGIWAAGSALWIGSWEGAARWPEPGAEGPRDQWFRSALVEGEPVTAALETRHEIWLGTQRRGLAVRAPTGEWRAYHEGNGLPDSWVTALADDGERLWAGTFNGGLAVWDGKRWDRADPVPGPGGRKVTCLAVDAGGAVWAGTRAGLARHDRGRWRVFTRADGLPGDEIQCLLPGGDGIWVGTRSGLALLPDR
jgi:ligand-binding sensor domain-containing protein